MLIIKADKNQRTRWYAMALTMFILGMIYLTLNANSITDASSRRIILTELAVININDFYPSLESEKSIDEPDSPENTEEEEVIPETEVVEEVVSPKRIDLSELLSEGVKVDLIVSNEVPVLSKSNQPDEENTSASLRLEESELDQFEGIRSLRGVGSRMGDLSQRSSTQGEGSGLAVRNGGLQLRSSGLSGIRGGIGLTEGPSVRNGWEEAIEISLKSLTEFGEGFDNMDPVIIALIQWMKKNPSDLPVAVKRTMSDNRWQDDFLTSTSRFVAEDREFELLLMVKEAIPELHIFLVEKDEATYLIDRGFQKQSSYLRRGRVIYNDANIQEVDSQMREASGSQTSEFYQVFLSWWRSIDSDG